MYLCWSWLAVTVTDELYCRLTDQQVDSSFHSFLPITEAELKVTILKSKPTACSMDPLATSLLEFLDDVLPTLTNIISFSLSSVTFTLTFRSSVVKPLLKKASLDPNNLKKIPVYFQPPFRVKNRREDCSPEAACLPHWTQSHLSFSVRLPPLKQPLLKVTNDVVLALNSGNVSLLTLLDLSTAFDIVDHYILFSRLKQMCGMSGTALSWISSYLANRTQSLIVDDHVS